MPELFWLGIIRVLGVVMKQAMELLNTNEIIVMGSLNPQKQVQDRVRILSMRGICQALRATDYKDPPKITVMYDER